MAGTTEVIEIIFDVPDLNPAMANDLRKEILAFLESEAKSRGIVLAVNDNDAPELYEVTFMER